MLACYFQLYIYSCRCKDEIFDQVLCGKLCVWLNSRYRVWPTNTEMQNKKLILLIQLFLQCFFIWRSVICFIFVIVGGVKRTEANPRCVIIVPRKKATIEGFALYSYEPWHASSFIRTNKNHGCLFLEISSQYNWYITALNCLQVLENFQQLNNRAISLFNLHFLIFIYSIYPTSIITDT